MGKLEEYKIGEEVLKILSKLPYRLECRLEGLIIKMAEGMEGKVSDLEKINFNDMEFSDMKGFDMAKKIDINDFLLKNAIFQPKITDEDLDNNDYYLNDKLREIGDYLFEKYIDQYNAKASVKKKVMK